MTHWKNARKTQELLEEANKQLQEDGLISLLPFWEHSFTYAPKFALHDAAFMRAGTSVEGTLSRNQMGLSSYTLDSVAVSARENMDPTWLGRKLQCLVSKPNSKHRITWDLASLSFLC